MLLGLGCFGLIAAATPAMAQDAEAVSGVIRGEDYRVKRNSLTAAGIPVGVQDGFIENEFSGAGVGLVFRPTPAGSLYA